MPSASSSNIALHFSRLAVQHSRTDKSRAQEASGYFLWLLYLTGFLLINIKSKKCGVHKKGLNSFPLARKRRYLHDNQWIENQR